MTTEQSEKRLSSLDELNVIVDGDAHVNELAGGFLEYISDDHGYFKNILDTMRGSIKEEIYSRSHAMPPYREGIQGNRPTPTVETKLEEMEEFDLDYAILDPGMNLGITTVENTRFQVALAEAYNEWIVDAFIDGHDNLVANIVVPPRKPDRAAEIIDRWGTENQFVGVALVATGLLPPPGHEWYDPIWQAAEDHDLPIVMHPVNTATMYAFPVQRMWHETYVENHAIVHPFTHMANLTTMIAQGVPAKYPDLDFVFQESGVGWVPYWKWRLDDHYLERSDEMPFNDQLPSQYIDDQFYFTTQPLGHTGEHNDHLAMAIEMAGPDSIIYASDLPHVDFDPPEELFNRIAPYFDAETVNGMMGENAMRVFDLQ